MVMPIRDVKLDGAAGADAVGGRMPTTASAPAAAAPKLSDRPPRRTFTGQDKLRILAEIDHAPAGGTAAILRREGLYSSTLSDWRGLRDAGALGGLTPIKRGPKPAPRNPLTAELAQAKRENARLMRRLEHAEAIIAIQKNWQPCWVCRWRHPTATTHHDRCRRRAGATTWPHRRCVRGSMAGLCTPLPTLRRHPHGRLRTARGRCGSLILYRSGLPPPTPCRSPGARTVMLGACRT
jgi:transposase